MKWKWTTSSFLACAFLGTVTGEALAKDHPARTVPNLSRLNSGHFEFGELERIIQGFRIAPVPLKLRGRDLGLVGLGSYLVNATGGCNDCHTNPPFAAGSDPFAGEPEQINAEAYLAGGTAFGPFVSRNITPDASGKPGGLSLSEFILVMRTGADLKALPPPVPSPSQDLLQVMPWPVYAKMITRDLKAIYEYLRSIPSR